MDRAVATANLEALHPMCETLLLTLLSLYEQWHGDYSAEVPRFSGIGAGGDNASVQVVRCTIETVFSVAPGDLVSKMLKQVLGKLLAAFTNEDPAEADRCMGQSIILTGLLSTVVRYVKDEGTGKHRFQSRTTDHPAVSASAPERRPRSHPPEARVLLSALHLQVPCAAAGDDDAGRDEIHLAGDDFDHQCCQQEVPSEVSAVLGAPL